MTTTVPCIRRGGERRRRLEEMLAFALAYRGWTTRQLGRALDRDPSNLVPDSGIPKLDLVVRLSEVLGWPLQEVVNELGSDAPSPHRSVAGRPNDRSEDGIDGESASPPPHGDPVADDATPMREVLSWEQAGRFAQAIEAARRGIDRFCADERARLPLMERLGVCYQATGHLVEARALAGEVADRTLAHEAEDAMLAMHARACARRGACRAEIALAHDGAAANRGALLSAANDLRRARGLLASPRVQQADRDADAVASVAKASLLEIEVGLGERPPREAVTEAMATIEAAIDIEAATAGPMLEALGWWCLAGCRIAMAHLHQEAELHRTLAILTNKADEIAHAVGSWRLHERVLTMEFARRERVAGWLGAAEAWVLDREDVRLIVGCVGGNPRFRETGLRILRAATITNE